MTHHGSHDASEKTGALHEMEEITVPSFRVALHTGKPGAGKPQLLIGKQIGTSMYTWNHIYSLKYRQQGGNQDGDSDLALKAGLDQCSRCCHASSTSVLHSGSAWQAWSCHQTRQLRQPSRIMI